MKAASSPAQVGDDAHQMVRVHAPQTFWRGFVPTVRDIVAHRDLLANLVRKELKIKYKDSTLGFLWSLARPLFLLTVYYIVFAVFLRSGIPDFPIYLFSGLVAFDLFSSIVSGGTTAIVGNAGLIKKVYFPREILILSVVGAAIVHFGLELVVMVIALLAFHHPFFGLNLLYLPLALVALLVFGTALGLLLSVANVRLRDVQHLIEVVMLFWFWTTPIVYLVAQAVTGLGKHHLAKVYLLNPMVNVVMAFQRAFYRQGFIGKGPQRIIVLTNNGGLGYRLVGVIAFSLVLLWVAQRIFAQAQGSFAQEL